MLISDTVHSLKDVLTQMQSIVVLLGPKPSFDQVVSALAFAQSLKEACKDVEIASPAPLDQADGLQQIIGIEAVKHKLGNRHLRISFPYREEALDKAS